MYKCMYSSTQSIIKCVVFAIAAATVFEHITAKYDGDGDSVYLPYNVHLITILLARLAMCLFIQFHSFSVGLGSAVEATCPFGWHLTPENTCIKLYGNTNTWANAQASCRSHGSQLVTLPNWRMINYVKGFLLSSGKYFLPVRCSNWHPILLA